MSRWPVLLLATLALAGPAAAAETAAPPSHLVAYHLDWLNYIDPADLPAERPAICLVDTGVLQTPDTPPDTIIARLAVDGGPGEPERTDDPAYLHGTRMAMAMAAPQNNWGTIGAWSGARIISVRATTAGESTFRPNGYQQGINRCLQYAADFHLELAVINLSLGCAGCSLTSAQQAALDESVQTAHKYGAAVVAAAGNDAGPVQTPASSAGAFVVAAGDPGGILCGYGSFGPQVAVLAPGCPIESADPLTGDSAHADGAGSSAATAIASTLVSALRSLRHSASTEDVEAWVRESALVMDGRHVLDGEAAARLAGLDRVVDRAQARQPAGGSTPNSAVAPPPTTNASSDPPGAGAAATVTPRDRLPTPVVRRAVWRRSHVEVRVSNMPRRARIAVQVARIEAGRGVHCLRRTLRRADGAQIRVPWHPTTITLRYLPAQANGRRRSEARRLYRHGNRYR